MGTDKIKPVRYCYIDLETTGVEDPFHFSPIQIYLEIEEVGGREGGILDLKVCPLKGDIMTAGATKAHGYTLEDVEKFMDPRFAIIELKRFLRGKVDKYDRSDKLFFTGYNAFFDYKALRVWFERQGVEFFGSFFWWPPIDVMSWAAEKLVKERHLIPDFSLSTVATYLDAEIDDKKLHDACYDIQLTKFIYKTLKARV